MKKSLLVFAITSVLAFAAQAADTPAVATNFSLTSNYKYRGQDQGGRKPAVQGGFDYADSGFYVGNWNSSVKQGNTTIEMDFYGGYKGEASGVGYDIGALQYYYPQKDNDLNTTELYGALNFGIASAKYSRTVSSKWFSVTDGRGTGYWDFSANYEVVTGVTLNGHLGFTQLSSGAKLSGVRENYSDYKLGVTYVLGSGFSLSGAAVGASKKDVWGDINKSRLILAITKAM